MGFGALPLQVYACVEFGMNAALSSEKHRQAWYFDARTASLLERILALHDHQLGSIRRKDLTAATERLEHFILSKRASPLPDELRAEARKLATEEIARESERTSLDKENS
jgi:hypothetical protein